MNRNALIGVIAVVLVLGAVYLSTTNTSAPVVDNNSDLAGGTQLAGTPAVNDTPDTPLNLETVTVTYTDQGFQPKTVNVKKGTKVTFVNESSKNMWVGVDEHPAHMNYAGTPRQDHCPDTAGTAFDQCATGTTYSFTFQKTGTWDYHNHVAATDEGTVVVTE